MLFQIFHCLLNRARYILLLDGEFGRENHKIEKQSVNGMGGPQISVKAWGIIAFQNLFQIARKPTGCFFVKHKLPHFFIFFRIMCGKGTLYMKNRDLPILRRFIVMRLAAVNQDSVTGFQG